MVRIDDPRLPERFWEKVREDDSGCWLWTAATNRNGYGSFHVEQPGGTRGKQLTREAHRHAYVVLVGDVPEGMELDHRCRNRTCCNPAHLEPVTHAENLARSSTATKTHCVNGHEFTDENTWVPKDRPTQRYCRACNRDRQRRRRTT